MAIKNRTKRPHAAERRDRREAFFSASKTTRGEWTARTSTEPCHLRDRNGRVLNRKSRRHAAKLRRPDVRRFERGVWARELGFAIRGFLRRAAAAPVYQAAA
jgi:hypothetical protein